MSVVSGRRQRLFAVAGALILLLVMVGLSRDFGFTWDERFQQKYGEEIWDYAHGRLPRSSFDTDWGNQYLYGGLVEILCVAAQHAFPGDTYVIRHMVIAVFGWTGIVFCGLAAARAFGARAGWIAAILLTVSPRYFGDAMNNPKDAPFAALAMAALYYTLTIDWRPPHLSWTHAAKLAAVIALAINVRPLGLVLLGYAAGAIMLVAAVEAWRSTAADRWRSVGVTVVRLAVVAIASIPLGTVAWPWAQGQPFVRPIQAFLISTRVNWAAGFDVLYDGAIVGAGSTPWHYVPKWLAMALPPVLLAGLVLSCLIWRLGSRAVVGWCALGAFAFAPVAMAIWRNATIYDGIRHLLFIVPPLTALAAGGWAAAMTFSPRARVAAVVALAIGIAEPVVFQIRNHPNQIVYFSPLFGGPKAAFARYDMDYWANSVLQAVKWSDRLARDLGTSIVVTGKPDQAVESDAARFKSLKFTRLYRPDVQLDIRLLRGSPVGIHEFADSADVLYRVTMADGTPLCVVLPGPAFGPIRDRMNRRGK
jgi:hypothetical protein